MFSGTWDSDTITQVTSNKIVPSLEKNTAQSGNKLNKYKEKFFFLVFRWSFHFTKYTRNFLAVKLMVLVDG